MKILDRFKAGEPLLDQVTADRLNTMVDAINARTPQPGVGTRLVAAGGGFSYSTSASGRGGGRSLGFDVSHTGDGEFSVLPSLVFGVEANTGTVPNIGGTLITNSPAPTVTATGGDLIYLKISLEPVAEGTSPGYFISPDSFSTPAGYATLADTVEIVSSGTAVAGTVNASDATTTTMVALLPLASVASSGDSFTVTQLMNGPVAVHYCSGQLDLRPPIYIQETS